MSGLKVKARKADFADRVEILLHWHGSDGQEYACAPVMLVGEKMKDGEVTQPTFSFDRESCENLMTALTNLGVEPESASALEAEADGLMAELESTRAHLQDMRKLVFEKPEVRIEEAPKLPALHIYCVNCLFEMETIYGRVAAKIPAFCQNCQHEARGAVILEVR